MSETDPGKPQQQPACCNCFAFAASKKALGMGHCHLNPASILVIDPLSKQPAFLHPLVSSRDWCCHFSVREQ